MIDAKAARNDPDAYRSALARKGAAEAFDTWLAADERWRSLVPKVDELRSREAVARRIPFAGPWTISCLNGSDDRLRRYSTSAGSSELDKAESSTTLEELLDASSIRRSQSPRISTMKPVESPT